MLAGGTDLIPQVNEYVCSAEVFVDAKRIPELSELEFSPQTGLTLGAAVPCYLIYANPDVRRSYGALVDAASIIGSTGIQGRASVGGNLCNSGPAGDSIPALIVHSAKARIAGPSGVWETPVEEFCTAPGKNVLQSGELLISLHLPIPAARSGSHYLRFIPRNEMDIAEVGVGASLSLNSDGSILSARVALGAVAPKPLYVPAVGEYLKGKSPTDDTVGAAGRIAQEACSPITDIRGTVDHRRHLVGVLTRRALQGALERATASVI
jgi:carbon-monoxide dehydrogenase medium subunit